jgi:alkanesulfonate monooxygenase SsuD/methylene tetrahydromethanopterin reductase-like flavin-dependent oxidoreductase (luciferase family)
MRHGIVLFTCDRGITPARAAKAAEERGFDACYVPEHTHIPAAGVTELLWGLPDAPAETVEAYLDRLASRISS